MKKWLLINLIFVFMILLVGCQSTQKSSMNTTSTTATTNITTIQSTISQVDNILPTFSGLKDWTLVKGSTLPNFKKGVTATDNRDGELEFSVNDSFVNTDLPGIYTVTYTAVDKAGNTAKETVSIEVKDFRSTVRNVETIVTEEQRLSFMFFWEAANTDKTSPGYGLVRDRYPGNSTLASIASVGFGLTSIPIGIENGWITYEEGYERTLGTIKTMDNLEKTHGFYYHFLNINTGKRAGTTEVSVIDTALMISGALFAGKYFGGEVEELANKLYEEVEWTWYVNKNAHKFYMGYKPETGFEGGWNGYAEQLIMYILGAGSPTYPTTKALYNVMKVLASKDGYRDLTTFEYRVEPFYHSGGGTLFTHQYSHAFVDFRNIVDKDGVNWFDNATLASRASLEFSKDMSNKYLSLNENSWGLTASDGPNGYKAYGSRPYDWTPPMDGTIAPAGAIGSIVYLPEDAIRAMNHYRTFDQLWGKYGFQDSYNLGTINGYVDPTIENKIPEGGWFARDVIGIDKGITVLMIENYRSDFVWNIFMEIDYVKNGLTNLEFKPATE